MIRVTLDTNTLISAIINRVISVSQEIYRNFKEKRFLLITSPAILVEFDEVVHRDRIMKFHKLSSKQLQIIVHELAQLSLVVSGETELAVVRDSDDNKIVSAALEGKADYIISRDKDLLDLKKYKGIQIITPESFMHVLRKEENRK